MAGYSVTDSTNNLMLEMSFNAFTEYQPQLQIDIRQRPQQGQGNMAPIGSASLLAYQLPLLLANIANHMESAIVQTSTRNGSVNLGRMANDFIISNNNGSFKVTLNDPQWNDTYNYIKCVYENSYLIREINRNIRMQMINLLREVGVDTPVNGRFRATPWYDYKIEQRLLGNGSNNFNREDASSIGATYNGGSYGASMPVQSNALNHPAGNTNSAAPTIGMPSGMALPPMPSSSGNIQQSGNSPLSSVNNTAAEASVPNMGVLMPPLSNPNNEGAGSIPSNNIGGGGMSLTTGIQAMLSDTFPGN